MNEDWDVKKILDWAIKKVDGKECDILGLEETLIGIGNKESDRFKLECGRGMGGCSWIIKITDKKLGLPFALKFPILANPNIVEVVRDEGEKTKNLHHPNVIQLFHQDKCTVQINHVEKEVDYFIEEFIDGVTLKEINENLHDDIKNINDLLNTCKRYIKIITQASEGINYLHSKGLIHCDIKPDNIMITLEDDRAVIIDMGFAHWIPPAPSGSATTVGFTWTYAHPMLKENIQHREKTVRATSWIPKDLLHKEFDMYPLGLTIIEFIQKIRKIQSKFLENMSIKDDIIIQATYYQRFLELVGIRLLCGQPENPIFKLDYYQNTPENIRKDIAYKELYEARNDLNKILDANMPEREIPELDPHPRKVLQQVVMPVPFTDRVRKIYNTPLIKRLAVTSQLGLVSLVYPGGVHSRREHVFGTFALTTRYILALWKDPENPTFRCLMNVSDLKTTLISAIIHDLGQFPMAHDVEDTLPELINHEILSLLLIGINTRDAEDKDIILPSNSKYLKQSVEELQNLIRTDWDVELPYIGEIILGNKVPTTSHSISKITLLHEIISGSTDADKLDYMFRDCIHLGVKFAEQIEIERLFRGITTGIKSINDEKRFGICITEKGLVATSAIFAARSQLYDKIYWHKTVRAFKAMLAYSLYSIYRKNSEKLKKDIIELSLGEVEFRFTHQEGLLTSYYEMYYLNLIEIGISELNSRDVELLIMLMRFGEGDVKKICKDIAQRNPFKVIYTISRTEQDAEPIDEVATGFYTAIVTRFHSGVDGLERFHKFRLNLENILIAKLRENNVTNAEKCLVLVDIPLRLRKGYDNKIFVLSPYSILANEHKSYGIYQMEERGKLRVYVRNEYVKHFKKFTRDTWDQIITSALK